MRQRHPDLQREGEAARPSLHAAPAPQIARLLALQGSAGNQAVGRMLARNVENDEIAWKTERKTYRTELDELDSVRKLYHETFALYADWPSLRSWDDLKRDAKNIAVLKQLMEADVVKAAAWLVIHDKQKERDQDEKPKPTPKATVEEKAAKRAEQPKKDKVQTERAVAVGEIFNVTSAPLETEPETPAAPQPPPEMSNLYVNKHKERVQKWWDALEQPGASPAHNGTSDTKLNVANAQGLVDWAHDHWPHGGKVFIGRGAGSGDWSGKNQLKIIHKSKTIPSSKKHVTWHLTLKPDVLGKLTRVVDLGQDVVPGGEMASK